MIGLAVDQQDLSVAEEFFELFKTPWERAEPGRKYRIILSTDGCFEHLDAEVILAYGSGEGPIDRETGMAVRHADGPSEVEWDGETFPVYGPLALFDGAAERSGLRTGGNSLDYRRRTGSRIVRRIGYDLFHEIRYLLTQGQPAAYALTPTLELHIALLRHQLLMEKIPFVEIPARPHGHDFICCLTHDLDFYGIRRHQWDRTLAGFMARSSIGTLADLVRRRRSLAEAAQNWLAFCSLPFVFLGILPDFWRPFEDYAAVENAKRSTFFVIPFKGWPGSAPDGTVKRWRAAPYGIGDIREDIRKAVDRGSEMGVHGIDAWQDVGAGLDEIGQLRAVTGQETAGVRMHWLYFSEDSPRRLEASGFTYDSTWGYNEAVGYRAGTAQVFRHLSSKTLMELPLSIMDSALFSAGRMALGATDALRLCRRIVANARKFGGTLVINWHDRSLAPERLWGQFYNELLSEIEDSNRVWFATAAEAVEWFRWRRQIRFRRMTASDGSRVEVAVPLATIRAGVMRRYRSGPSGVNVEETACDGRRPMGKLL